MTHGNALKLLMLASSYPRHKEDSASVFLRHLAQSLSQRGLRVAVLATRVGGISDVVDDGDTEVMVEKREPKQLAEAITKLISDSELRDRLANNTFAKVTRCYDWQKIAMAFESLYRTVL